MHPPRPEVASVAVILLLLATAGSPRAQKAEEAALMLEAAIQKHVAADFAGAISEYEAVLEKYPEERRIVADALWRLGQAQERVGRLDLARQVYRRLVRDHAGHVNAAAATQRLAALVDEDAYGESALRDARPAVVVDTSICRGINAQQSAGPGRRLLVFPDVSVYDPATKESRRLNTGARPATYAVLSDTRPQVAYVSGNGDIEQNVARSEAGYANRRSGVELRVMNIDGTHERVIHSGRSISCLRPFKWSPDGNSILTWVERTNGTREIAVVGLDGSVRVLKRSVSLPAQDMSFSPNGRFVAYEMPTAPSLGEFDIVVLPSDGDPDGRLERRFLFSQARQRVSAPNEDELVVHVLNRAGFGPRPGDIERVKAMGIEAYIAQQLHPEKIPDARVDDQVARYPSLRMDIPELLEKSIPVAIVARRRATIFERPEVYARERAQAAANPDPVASAGGPTRVIVAPDAPAGFEIGALRLYRAVHSERQLQEVMVDFWMNHFNVNNDDHQLTSHYEETIRSRALGRFEDLLAAVSKHPRMLFYLDNWRSSAPADVIEARLTELGRTADFDGKLSLMERRTSLKETKGLNENFARELMELHTVGVDGGYTQADVVNVAKILTGWTIRSKGLVNAREEDGVFWFDPVMHVDGDKVVMGRTIKGGGVEEGEQLLTALAHHPSTARFIATKLARRFVADEPPAAVVEAAARAFSRTNGDIRETLRAILMSPQFQSREALQVKIKKPIELVASALRAVDARFESMDVYLELMGPRGAVGRMGERIYTHEEPDGNPDVGPAWMNSNALLVRLDFGNSLATGRIRGVTPNLSVGQTLLSQLGIPKPTALQIEQTRTMLQSGATPSPVSGAPAMALPTSAVTPKPGGIDPAAVAVAAMLGSPQFQKR